MKLRSYICSISYGAGTIFSLKCSVLLLDNFQHRLAYNRPELHAWVGVFFADFFFFLSRGWLGHTAP